MCWKERPGLGCLEAGVGTFTACRRGRHLGRNRGSCWLSYPASCSLLSKPRASHLLQEARPDAPMGNLPVHALPCEAGVLGLGWLPGEALPSSDSADLPSSWKKQEPTWL